MKEPCSIEGCDAPSFCRTWCAKHYSRWQTHGDPRAIVKSKRPSYSLRPGDKFERLTFVKYEDSKMNSLGKPVSMATFECECGVVRIFEAMGVANGHSRSCGCLVKDSLIERLTTHNLSRTKEYRAWAHMLDRCENENCEEFKHYGGRGIKVCILWHDFEGFIRDMGFAPSPRHQIERKNNDGPYALWNCCWDTRNRQMRNTRVTRRVIYNGQERPLIDLSEEKGIPHHTVVTRINRGWSVEKALETPVQQRSVD